MIDIYQIEEKYQNRLEKSKEWNYLRNYYRFSFDNNTVKLSSINKADAFKSMFYGFSNWFRRYKYIVFSSTDERKCMNNIYFDIRMDYIIDTLGNEKTLLIEEPNQVHYREKDTHTKYIVSKRVFDFLVVVYEKFSNKLQKIELFEEINNHYNISFDYAKQINRFNIQYKLYKTWLKIMKPKVIFFSCFYSKQYIVKAANELNILTIDVQHGLITNQHSAYFTLLKFDNIYFPNHLLSFGKNLLKKSKYHCVVDINNIYPVGNYYLEHIKKEFLPYENLQMRMKDYTTIIGITLQHTIEEKMIKFISEAAFKSPQILFILIPRVYKNNIYLKYNLSNNIVFYPKLSCYEIIMHCDYHCTGYSTCALEAPSLGILNILIDIDGYSTKFLKKELSSKYSFIVSTEDEFISSIKTVSNVDKYKIIESNHINYLNNYQSNILQYIKENMNVK